MYTPFSPSFIYHIHFPIAQNSYIYILFPVPESPSRWPGSF